jgi:hypothetical protein
MVWLFLSWSIDYRIKNKKTKSGRITFLNFNHPISHCDKITKILELLPQKNEAVEYFNFFTKHFIG